MLSPEISLGSNMNIGTGFDNNVFDEWIDTVPWLNVDLVNWVRFCLFIFSYLAVNSMKRI